MAVVDDDPSVLRSLEYLLDSADFAVRLFPTASALLESGCLATIDCVISDIDMPDIDGYELVGVVRAARPGVSVILITGYPERLRPSPFAPGARVSIFTKPFKGQELLGAVDEALRNARTGTRSTTDTRD